MRFLLIFLALPLFAIDVNYGIDLLRNGKYQEAKHFFEKSITLEPQNPANYLYLGYSFLALNMPDSAEFYAVKGLAIAPNSRELKILKISALVREKKFKEAKSFAELYFSQDLNDSTSKLVLAEVFFNYAGYLYQQGRKKDAIEFYKKVIKLKPNFPGSYTNIGIIFYEFGKNDSAMKYIEAGLDESPADPGLLKAKAQILAKEKKYKELIDVLNVLTTVEPESVILWLKLALVYRATGKMDSAIAIYKKLIKKFPDDKRIYEAYSQIYEGIFNYKKAREIYSIYLQKHPNDEEFLRRVAATYEGEGDYKNALKIYKRLHSGDALTKVAELQAKIGEKDEALKTYRKVLRMSPFNQDIWIQASQLLNGDSLIYFLDSMQTRLPRSPYPCSKKGLFFLERDDSARAKICLERAVELGTTYAEVYDQLARMYFSSGENQKGKLTVKIAFRVLTGNISGIQKILSGNQNLLELKKHEKEIKRLKETNEYLREMLSLLKQNVSEDEYINFLNELYMRYPTSFLVLESLTNFFIDRGEYRKALVYATRLVDINPDLGKNHYLRGKVLAKMGSFDEAFIEYEKAVSGGVKTVNFAKDFIALGEEAGKVDKAIETLRQVDSPEVQNYLENYKKSIGRK